MQAKARRVSSLRRCAEQYEPAEAVENVRESVRTHADVPKNRKIAKCGIEMVLLVVWWWKWVGACLHACMLAAMAWHGMVLCCVVWW